jgi:SAM-dependent methyltransferase
MLEYYTDEETHGYFSRRARSRDLRVQRIRASILSPHIHSQAKVADFGCGTGAILANVACAERWGVEVSPPAVKEAERLGLRIVPSVLDLPENYMDVVISHHSLEHVSDPHATLLGAWRALKVEGVILVILPAESPLDKRHAKYNPSDTNRHMYSWTPLSIGHLLSCSGFSVTSCEICAAGFTRYTLFLSPLPAVFRLCNRLVACALGRYDIIAIGTKTIGGRLS